MGDNVTEFIRSAKEAGLIEPRHYRLNYYSEIKIKCEARPQNVDELIRLGDEFFPQDQFVIGSFEPTRGSLNRVEIRIKRTALIANWVYGSGESGVYVDEGGVVRHDEDESVSIKHTDWKGR
jgi:hypothetical protein